MLSLHLPGQSRYHTSGENWIPLGTRVTHLEAAFTAAACHLLERSSNLPAGRRCCSAVRTKERGERGGKLRPSSRHLLHPWEGARSFLFHLEQCRNKWPLRTLLYAGDGALFQAFVVIWICRDFGVLKLYSGDQKECHCTVKTKLLL